VDIPNLADFEWGWMKIPPAAAAKACPNLQSICGLVKPPVYFALFLPRVLQDVKLEIPPDWIPALNSSGVHV